MSKTIRPLQKLDLPAILTFTDNTIGTGYFTAYELEDIFQRSQKSTLMASFVLIAEDGHTIEGLRISFPPKNWSSGKGSQLSPHLWRVSIDDVAYFQSLFLSPQTTGQGWGAKLSQSSIDVLKKLDTKAIVTHSWVESPHNSSTKYLRTLNFESITRYPQYWKNVSYICPLCGTPCLCTAEEMILYLL